MVEDNTHIDMDVPSGSDSDIDTSWVNFEKVSSEELESLRVPVYDYLV